MSVEMLTMLVVTLAPIVIYVTVALVLQLPELVAGWPAAVRHSIEISGGLLIAAAWLTIDSIGGGLAVLGLLLLAAPSVARYLSLPVESSSRRTVHRPKSKKSARFM
jgi:hypothetical protein